MVSLQRRSILRGLVLLGALIAGLFTCIGVSSSTPLKAHRPARQPSQVDLGEYRAGHLQFPEARWELMSAETLGWSADDLESTRKWVAGLDTSAVMVVHRGVLVAEWGNTHQRYLSQSIRKSLLSALLGRLVTEGNLKLEATLEDLGIDDLPPLSAEERQATVRDLLLSRSGVYHSAIYEAGSWKRRKPGRGSHPPGSAWYYNNWGFNALGTIFETTSGLQIEDAFFHWVAAPLEMEDFRPRDVKLLTRDHWSESKMGNQSDHGAHVFRISTRDLARFGLLYLADGSWAGQPVLDPGWVRASTFEDALPTGLGNGKYGYMWWVKPATKNRPYIQLIARGGRGHFLILVPDLDLVVVHRVPSSSVSLFAQLYRRFVWRPSVSEQQVEQLLDRIVAAMPAAQPLAAQERLDPAGGRDILRF